MLNTKVGIREFRENLSNYLESTTPVAITRHGNTIGVYIPTPRKRSEEDVAALLRAGEQIDALIAKAGVTEQELVEDFREERRKRRKTS
jgi:antitoxin (DNA-binding transcriptional repressor) of toxin-antitoxin stability system